MKKVTISISEIIATAFLVVDLFCGAGGTTCGFLMTNGLAKVIACVNHDKNAIQSHWMNNPEVKHFEEDIRTLDLTELTQLVRHYRAIYPGAKIILWASLECTNFSKAKGGQSRDGDSRTLADHLIRYITSLNPDIVQIENVVEFMAWGPLTAKVVKTDEGYDCCEVDFVEQWEDILDKNGEPIIETKGKRKGYRKQKLSGKYKAIFKGYPESSRNGEDFVRWCKSICDLGFFNEWKELNSANFGAYTSRNRLFGMFAREKSWIAWPEPTHFKKPSTGTLFEAPKRWKPVKEVLDFQDEGKSIFGRKKNLSPKTLERIYAGLVKYVALGDTSFIAKYYSGRPEGKVINIHGPAGTVKCRDGQSLVQMTPFLAKYYGTGNNVSSIEDPAGALRTKDCFSKYQPVWLDRNFSGGGFHSSIESPAGSLLRIPKLNKIQTIHWLDKQFSGSANHQSMDQPAGSILKNDKHSLMNTQFLTNFQYGNKGTSVESSAPALLASRRHYYLLNPQWGSKGQSVENPCFTLIARMDKMPPSLIMTETGQMAIRVLRKDCKVTKKIKQFMAAYGIVDIKMRMLKVPELLKIQGFPDDYMLFGNQTDQKKFIGNSVVPLVVKHWIESIGNGMQKLAA